MGEDLKALAQVFVGAAKTLPPTEAVDIVYSALKRWEREAIVASAAEAKTIVDGLHALAASMANIVRTRGPIIPVLMELVALEDAVRANDPNPWGLRDALAKVAAARELPRGDAAQAG